MCLSTHTDATTSVLTDNVPFFPKRQKAAVRAAQVEVSPPPTIKKFGSDEIAETEREGRLLLKYDFFWSVKRSYFFKKNLCTSLPLGKNSTEM